MDGAEISGRSRNTRREQKYREEVGIYGVTRNTWKKSEYMKGAEISRRSRNTWRVQKYWEEVGIYGVSRNTGKK